MENNIYEANKKPNAVKIAKAIQAEHTIMFCADSFYLYEQNYYQALDTINIEKWIITMLGENFTAHIANEIIRVLKADCFIKPEDLNHTKWLNVRNGFLDLDTLAIYPHCSDMYFTVQLAVSYNENATCPLWTQTLKEIFQGESWKIELLQEFFGLCLTQHTKYQKALFCIGEGANGKSTVLEVLEELVGSKNRSAVPLDKFADRHYLANLHGKLVNISIETNAKSGIYDSTFKAVVSGDSMEADRKHAHPFTFRPFCKLAIATNNMPRVDDKTPAFYRRLLIVEFTRIFKEHEQDKNLKQKLLAELDGIFVWALTGLKRLEAREHFEDSPEMQTAVNEYKKENNNVLIFIEETCQLSLEATVSKADLYEAYQTWGKANGNMPLGKTKFGKELRKQYKDIQDVDTAQSRNWGGIRLIESPAV